MSPREALRLIPLLGVYLVAHAVFPDQPGDEASYVDLARRLTRGTYVTGNEGALLDADPTSPDLWFGPGLPAVLSPLVALDAPIWMLRLTGPLFLFGAMLVFYALARRAWQQSTALLVTYAVGFYPPFWPLVTSVHSEPLAVLLVALAMLGLAAHLARHRIVHLALASGALAGLALTRVAYGWVLIAVLLLCAGWWAWRRSDIARRTAIAAGIALLACTPWLAYTYAKTDRVLQWGNSGALSLYWMASPYEGDDGDWRQADDVFTDPTLARHRQFFAGLRGLTLAEQNAEIEREALGNIVEHPLSYAENVTANASRLLLNVPYSDSRWQANDLFYAVPHVLVAIATALAGVALLRRRGSLPPETGPFALVAGVALLLHLLVATYPRMLAPVLPLLGWLVALAAVEAGTLDPRRAIARRRAARRATSGAARAG